MNIYKKSKKKNCVCKNVPCQPRGKKTTSKILQNIVSIIFVSTCFEMRANFSLMFSSYCIGKLNHQEEEKKNICIFKKYFIP
jgi:hypothetical protein